jgi:hypothetical protein
VVDRTEDGVTIVAPVVVGRNYPDGYYYLAGTIDDVRIYERALTQAEIQALASQQAIGGKGR